MLKILGQPTKLCDGITRRELLRVGALSLFGSMTLPRLLQAADATPTLRRRAQSVILINLLGGPSHMDMFDLKPDAPTEIRGEFMPINTSVPGLQVCEHLPKTARWMHKATLIRTVTHTYDAHNPLAMMTGFAGGENRQVTANRTDPPDIGAICQYLGMSPKDVPGAVCMPCYPGWGEGIQRPGPYGGYLGSEYDPLFTRCEPTFKETPKVKYYDPVMPYGEPLLPPLNVLPEITANRLNRRRSLLEQINHQFARLENSRAFEGMDKFQARAFALLSSRKTRNAFDLSKEPDAVRDRYGRNLYGSSVLLARRLVEAGVTFVSVHQEIFGANGHSYDMHENNFGMLKDFNLPLLDTVYPALIQDLDERGLLDSTLVVVMGEMGRTPRINARAGRDHWPQCGFCLLTGGGIKEGMVYGATDKHGAYPVSNPVSPSDIVATIYHLLGIDPHMTVPDLTGRPVSIAHGGEPVWNVVA
jgi:hypothetical protein